mgnify:CR=1 FL=1
MKYDELDLHNLLPYGIPLNTADHVEPTGYINDFFLIGFTTQYEVIQYFAPGCSAPYSLEANRICDDSVLQRFIEEAGAEYYPVDHEILAQFTQKLYTIPLGTPAIVDALVKYACDNDDVTGKIEATTVPHVYDIAVSGDIVGSSLTADVVSRLEGNLDNLLPVSEQWHGFNFTEEDQASSYAGASVPDVSALNYINYADGTRLGWMNTQKTSEMIASGTTHNLYNTFTGTGGLSQNLVKKLDGDLDNYEIVSITFANGTTQKHTADDGLSLAIAASVYIRLQNNSSRTLSNVLYVTLKYNANV